MIWRQQWNSCQNSGDIVSDLLGEDGRHNLIFSVLTLNTLLESCRIALMATADLQGLVIDPAPLSTWDHVEREALKVSRNCVGKKEGGGLVIIAGKGSSLAPLGPFLSPIRLVLINTVPADPVGYGALTLYMYAVGSPFEALLTNYMITSEAVHPPNTLGQGSNGSLIWLAANGSVEAPPTEAVRLLQSIQ